MADAALAARSPLEGLDLPSGPRFALAEAPAAARLILRGAEAVRVAYLRSPPGNLPRLPKTGDIFG